MKPTEQQEKLLALIKTSISEDVELRTKYQIGEKFKFVAEQLRALESHAKEVLHLDKIDEEEKRRTLFEDETIVYVILYNVNGSKLENWEKMLNPSYFYEYSVNRPIYNDLSNVETFLRTKTNLSQYAFLAIALKKNNIFSQKDTKLVKVKEGSLKFENVMFFVHAHHQYHVNKNGKLIVTSDNQS